MGLPDGQMGNSEVGHLNLGAGAVVQPGPRPHRRCDRGRLLRRNAVLRAALTDGRARHLIGLVSDGGVHSGWEHLEALIRLAADLGVEDLVVHAFTDGRDTLAEGGRRLPRAGPGWCADAGAAASARSSAATSRWIATSAGTGSSRRTTCSPMGAASTTPPAAPDAARAAYERGETDEFIAPTTVGEEARIRPGDSVIAFNFRPDRMREITRALAEPGFGEIDRGGAAPVERYTT